MKKVIYLFIVVLIGGRIIFGGFLVYPANNPQSRLPIVENGDDDGDSPPGTVKVSPEKQQMIGVQVGLAEKKGNNPHDSGLRKGVALTRTGFTDWSPRAKGGWSIFREGRPGAWWPRTRYLSKFSGREIFNRDIISDQQAFFLALNTRDRKKAENAPEEQLAAAEQQVQMAERNLMAIGMSDTQIKELARTRKPEREIEIRAPVAGIVLARNVFPELLFERNTELYRIADLSRVWILADVYENEAAYFKPGLQARVTLSHQKKTFQARVSQALPLFDAATRTLKVRLEVDNPGYALRPDMFVDVEFPIQLPPAITVPVRCGPRFRA